MVDAGVAGPLHGGAKGLVECQTTQSHRHEVLHYLTTITSLILCLTKNFGDKEKVLFTSKDVSPL